MAPITLGTLSAYCLGYVLDFCGGGDILRLLQCGNQAFSARVLHSARKFDFPALRFSKFPFLAFNFPQLRHLSVVIEGDVLELPLDLGERLPLPMEPVMTLEKLRYRFCQSGSIFGSPSPLSWYFPNLVDLHLNFNSVTLEMGFVDELPVTLRRLHIVNAFPLFDNPSMCIPYSVIFSLSSRLEYLHLFEFKIGKNDEEPSTAFDKSSSTLIELHLSVVSHMELLRHLPSSLEVVEVVTDPDAPTSAVPVPLSCLPPNLRAYRADGEVILDTALPPCLEEWESAVTVVDEMMDLPASLKLGEYLLPLYGRHLDRLPPNLTSLSLGGYIEDFDEVKSLPATLRRLNLSPKVKLSHYDRFPASLTSIHHSSIESGLAEGSSMVWQRFGQLVELSVSYGAIGKEDVFLNFPLLAQLWLTVPSASALPLELVSSLPKETMRRLYVNVEGVRDWSPTFRGLSRLSNLQQLIVYTSSPNVVTEPTFLLELPQGLKELNCPMESEWDSLFLHSLPPSISYLTLHSNLDDSDPPLPISDHHFAHLPPSLTMLSLPSLSGISPLFFQLLPPRISHVSLSVPNYEGDLNADIKAYYASFNWFGFPPLSPP